MTKLTVHPEAGGGAPIEDHRGCRQDHRYAGRDRGWFERQEAWSPLGAAGAEVGSDLVRMSPSVSLSGGPLSTRDCR